MSKLVNKSIQVQTNQGQPSKFYYGATIVVKEIFDYWRETGQWWLGESELHVYRVQARHSLWELHHIPQTDNWLLYRIED